MLNITYHPERPIEEGQYYVELVTFEPTLVMNVSGRFGYFCDLAHIENGILTSLVGYSPSLTSMLMEDFEKRMKESYERMKNNV